MNAPLTPKPGIDAFHRERSKFIDAFSQLESSIVWLLSKTGHACGSEHFGQKLTLLKKAKPSSKLSKAQLSKVHALLDRCETLAELRNDIVHSTMQLASIAESNRACFINIRYCEADGQTARLFTLESLRGLSAEVLQLADKFRNSESTQGSDQHK